MRARRSLPARTVYEMCRGGNYRYRDFAVVCRKPEIYNSVIKKVFGDYNIPGLHKRKKLI